MKVKLCLVLIEIFHLYLRCTVEEHKVYKEASIENIRKIRLCQPPPLPFLCMILGCDLNTLNMVYNGRREMSLVPACR